MKKKKIISTDAEKTFEKFLFPLMLQTISKLRIEHFFKLIKKYLKNLELTSYFMAKTECFHPQFGDKARMLTAMASFPQWTGYPGLCSEAKNINKRQKDWKVKSETVFIANCMITYMENPKEPTKKAIRTNKWDK